MVEDPDNHSRSSAAGRKASGNDLRPDSTRVNRFLGPSTCAFVFAGTALLGQALWFVLPEDLRRNPSTDFTAYYEPVARNLAAGTGLTSVDGGLAIRYPPGY